MFIQKNQLWKLQKVNYVVVEIERKKISQETKKRQITSAEASPWILLYFFLLFLVDILPPL
jgi:hypothetical protein